MRIVIKIGTSTLTHNETGKLNFRHIKDIAEAVSDIQNMGHEVVVVSSGAIPVGRSFVSFPNKELSLSEKQAAASIGQPKLIAIYHEYFSNYGKNVAQILLSYVILGNEDYAKNAAKTFDELLVQGVIPIVNENDAITNEEIKVGDNDTLSAYVAKLVNADMLIILSDIDGLYNDNPHINPAATIINEVAEITNEIHEMAGDAVSGVGTGGMATKVTAAEIATEIGADTIIINGNDMRNLYSVVNGEQVGTRFIGASK
jgi:glutamate 5-kinase